MLVDACEALVVRTKDGVPQLSKEDVPAPTPQSHQMLIKVSHVAQNPTDVQALDNNVFGDGTILGCDFVGTVVQLGSGVKSFKEGDVIAGLIWGGEIKGLGGYSAYTLADERICFKVPDGITLQQAATIPLAACTSWLALFSKGSLNIDRKSSANVPVLIWGGSSSVGLYAIQLASQHGLEVITTCSPRHFDNVRSLGAKHVFDYRSENVVDEIKKVSSNILFVFDTIGNESSSAIASRTISEHGGTLCTVRPGKANTEGVSKQTAVTDVLVWTAFLKEHRYKSFVWPADEHDHELSAELFGSLPQLLTQGKLKPNSPKLFDNGLNGVAEGFAEHRAGKISNYKIVYQL